MKKQSTSMVKNISTTSAAAAPAPASPSHQVDLARRKDNRYLPTARVLDLLKRWLPRAYELSEVVGQWVWVRFTEKQPAQVTRELSQLGFHWNSRRQAWQHPCGVFKGEPSDPRSKYQAYHPADQVPA